MKIVVTGSLGRISKPLTQELLQQGHSVTVISSNPEKQKVIEALGAKAAIGSLANAGFLTATFKGADAVYAMEPPPDFFDHGVDMSDVWKQIAQSYAQAIQQSGVEKVVHLSSIGSHTNKGNGMLSSHYEVEQILQQLPGHIAVTTLRPVGFYYNMLEFIRSIKKHGAIITNYNATYKEPWVSPLDIAAVVAEEITKDFSGRKVRYIASDEQTSDDIAAILGEAIGKPGLKWNVIPDEQLLSEMTAAGMSPQAAKGLTEMNAARRSGTLYEDYDRNRPILGKIKISAFAKEFAAMYDQQ